MTACEATIHLAKRLEYLRQLVRRDTDSRVGNRNGDHLVLRHRTDDDRPSLSELDRIANQVEQDLT